MTAPADTIREALGDIEHHAWEKREILAALTELEQQLAALREENENLVNLLETKTIKRLQAQVAELTEHANGWHQSFVAAEADRDRLADTLREITRCVFLDDAHSAARAALDRHTKAEA